MTDETVELKPCPFCGGKAELSHGQMGVQKAITEYIECIDCGASSDMFFSIVEAMNVWNKRI